MTNKMPKKGINVIYFNILVAFIKVMEQKQWENQTTVGDRRTQYSCYLLCLNVGNSEIPLPHTPKLQLCHAKNGSSDGFWEISKWDLYNDHISLPLVLPWRIPTKANKIVLMSLNRRRLLKVCAALLRLL